jgi:hypothetical protein
LSAVNAENDESIPLTDGLKLKVPRHDVRVILVAPAGLYPAKKP